MTKEDTKRNVLLCFDEALLIDAKKVLFSSNLTLQQYITFILHKLSMEDPSAKDLLNRAVRFNEEQLSSTERKTLLKIDANNLYSLFERQDQQEK